MQRNHLPLLKVRIVALSQGWSIEIGLKSYVLKGPKINGLMPVMNINLDTDPVEYKKHLIGLNFTKLVSLVG